MADTRAMPFPVVLIIGLVALHLVQHVAVRRLGTKRARYAWLSLARGFVVPVALLVPAVTLASTQPFLGVVLGVVGLGYGYLIVRMVRGVARATASTASEAEVQAAIIEPMTDFMLITTIIGVVGLIAVGVVAIVVALAERGS